MSGLTIRRLAPGDEPLALALLEAQFAEHAIAIRGAPLAAAATELVANPELGALLLAQRGGLPIGIAVLTFGFALESGGVIAWLDELYVIPPERAAGVGSRLLDAAVAIAEEAGCRAVELEVEADHARAANLYLRQGFALRTRARYVKHLSR